METHKILAHLNWKGPRVTYLLSSFRFKYVISTIIPTNDCPDLPGTPLQKQDANFGSSFFLVLRQQCIWVFLFTLRSSLRLLHPCTLHPPQTGTPQSSPLWPLHKKSSLESLTIIVPVLWVTPICHCPSCHLVPMTQPGTPEKVWPSTCMICWASGFL